MLWTLVMPELVLIWAYRQWDAAKYISEYFQGGHGNVWLFFCNLLRNYRRGLDADARSLPNYGRVHLLRRGNRKGPGF